MQRNKKILANLVTLASAFSLAGCSLSFNKGSGGLSGNTIVDQNGNGNTQAQGHVIYFNHIDGEGNYDNKDTNKGKLTATVKFEFEAITENYSNSEKVIRYQVEYIACNCRSSDFNPWTTLYVELSASKADLDNPDGSKIVAMSYGTSTFTDDFGHYTQVGHWGDSFAMDRNTNVYASEHAKAENLHGATYEDFQDEILPFLTGVTRETLHDWMTNPNHFNEEGFFEHEKIQAFQDKKVDRYTATLEGYNAVSYSSTTTEVSLVDAYAGASVSLDNMLSVLDALFDYHAEKLAKIKKDPKKSIFYSDADLEFTGTYHLEKDTTGETIVPTDAISTLQAMLADNGTYMIYAAKEGCATCAAFSKAVNSYLKKFHVKIYEVLFSEVKTIEALGLKGAHSTAPQLFLISNGAVVAYATQETIDTAAETGSYLTIFDGFTHNLLAE